MPDSVPLILPDWPAPASVHAAVSTRARGISLPPYDSLNLGGHVGDEPAAVAENRARLRRALQGMAPCSEPQWLNQVHGVIVIEAADTADVRARWAPDADGVTTNLPGIPCVVMTADCLPVLFCDRAGTRVAAAHAGWRGLCAGVLEATLASFANPAEVLCWLGPAIGPDAFEVGAEVRVAFMAHDAAAETAFRPAATGKFMADIYLLARQRLQAAGVAGVYGGDFCTVRDSARFFSYRRDGRTGRMGSVIWLG
jgi:YfiH family protein